MKKFLKAAAAALIMALVACGTDNFEGVEFVVANGPEPQSLDPSQTTGMPERRIFHAIYSGFTTYDAAGNVIPDLAERWEVSADGLTVDFFIRQGLRFSDGTPLTAHEIVDSLLHRINPETAWPYANDAILTWLDGEAALNGTIPFADARVWQVINDHQVRFNRITPTVVHDWGTVAYMVMPMHVVRQHGSQWTQPGTHVSSGPFVLDQWIPQDQLVLSPNEHYHNRANVFIDRLVIKAIPDLMTAFNAFRNGEVDWSTDIPGGLNDVISIMPELQVVPQMGTQNYAFNTTHPNLSDVRVRRALAMTIDREAMVQLEVLSMGEIPVRGIVPVALRGAPFYYPHFDNTNAAGDMFNPTLARQLLAEAGYPNGEGFPTLTMLYNTMDEHRIMAEFIGHSWQTELNINVELRNMEWQSFLASRGDPEVQLFRFGWVSSADDPMGFLQIFMTNDGNNHFRYSDPEVDALLTQAFNLPAGNERTRIMRAAEEIIINRDQAILPLYNYTQANLIDLRKWAGWEPNPTTYNMFVGIRPR